MSLLLTGVGQNALSPANVAGLVAWYSSADVSKFFQDSGATTPVTADGDPIGAWLPSAGASIGNATQGTGGAKPTYRVSGINGRPSVQFDGGDYLSSVDASVASVFSGTDKPFCTMAVVCPTTIDINASITGLGRSSSAVPFRNFRLNASNRFELAQRNDANVSISNDAPDILGVHPYLLTEIYNGATTELYVGNVIALPPEAATTGALTLDTFAIGALVRNTASLFWTGYIAEVVVATAFTISELIGLQAYFRRNYGV